MPSDCSAVDFSPERRRCRQGIGEKFDANPVTGTGSMSVPIATRPTRGCRGISTPWIRMSSLMSAIDGNRMTLVGRPTATSSGHPRVPPACIQEGCQMTLHRSRWLRGLWWALPALLLTSGHADAEPRPSPQHSRKARSAVELGAEYLRGVGVEPTRDGHESVETESSPAALVPLRRLRRCSSSCTSADPTRPIASCPAQFDHP